MARVASYGDRFRLSALVMLYFYPKKIFLSGYRDSLFYMQVFHTHHSLYLLLYISATTSGARLSFFFSFIPHPPPSHHPHSLFLSLFSEHTSHLCLVSSASALLLASRHARPARACVAGEAQIEAASSSGGRIREHHLPPPPPHLPDSPAPRTPASKRGR